MHILLGKGPHRLYISCMRPGQRAQWAILQEAAAIKAGNVHPTASFPDMRFSDFERSAAVIGDSIDRNSDAGLGPTILACAQAMMEHVGLNTSLGTILLLVPLAKVDAGLAHRPIGDLPSRELVRSRIEALLHESNAHDSECIYNAILRCRPGGLGKSKSLDIDSSPPDSILEAMRLAAQWDDIARQYIHGFEDVFQSAGQLATWTRDGLPMGEAVRRLQVEMLADRVDSLIVRKYGRDVGLTVQAAAQQVVRSGPYGSAAYEANWQRFDQCLREPQQRRNPGTIADLIAGALYVEHAGWI